MKPWLLLMSEKSFCIYWERRWQKNGLQLFSFRLKTNCRKIQAKSLPRKVNSWELPRSRQWERISNWKINLGKAKNRLLCLLFSVNRKSKYENWKIVWTENEKPALLECNLSWWNESHDLFKCIFSQLRLRVLKFRTTTKKSGNIIRNSLSRSQKVSREKSGRIQS